MGKASKFKKFKRLAAKLPAIQNHTREYHIMTGVEAIEHFDGPVFPDTGIQIDPTLKYKVPMPVIMELNHSRRIKKYYNQFGAIGVKGYAEAVIRFDTNKKLKDAVPQ